MIINEEKRQQIMSYIVHAWEILAKDSRFPKKTYKYAYIPSGAELYTWALKSVWYLFLDKNIEHIVFFMKQNDHPNDIVSYKEDNDFLIWWGIIKNKNIFDIKTKKPIPNELFEQLLYARLLTKIKSTTMIWIGENLNINEFIKHIPNNIWIVFLWTMSKEKTIEHSKKEDKKMIENILSQKIYRKDNKRLWNMYTKITKIHKRKSELIVYVHSSELWIKKQEPVWYSCIVS